MPTGRYAPLTDEEAHGLLVDLEREEDWRLALPYMPDDRRGGALVLYALAKELGDAPGRVSEAPLGMIRFQWWREATAEAFGEGTVRRHPLALALAATISTEPLLRPAVDAMVDGAEEALSAASTPATVGEAVSLSLPLYGGLGSALCRWITREEVREEAVAYALAISAATLAARGEPVAGRGLPRVVDLIAGGPRAADYADAVASHHKTLRRLPAALVPAALPFALSGAYAAGRSPGPLAKRARLFRTVLTGRF